MVTASEEGATVNEQTGASGGRSDPMTWVGVDPSKDDTRPPPLSRARVVRAALHLVDEKGLAALTMRALATDLEASPMALYNHVRDKDELVDLMVDLMLGEVDTSPSDGDWLAQLRTLVRSYRQALVSHHQLARGAYSSRVRIGPNGLLIMERAIGLLLQGGFSHSEACDAFFALYTYTAGFQLMGHIAPVRDTTSGPEYYPPLPREQIPAITAVHQYLDGMRRPGRFDYGLELLLAGIKTKVTQAEDTANPPPVAGPSNADSGP